MRELRACSKFEVDHDRHFTLLSPCSPPLGPLGRQVSSICVPSYLTDIISNLGPRCVSHRQCSEKLRSDWTGSMDHGEHVTSLLPFRSETTAEEAKGRGTSKQ